MRPSRFDPWGQEGESKWGQMQAGTVLYPWADPDPHSTRDMFAKVGCMGEFCLCPPHRSAELPTGALET